MGEWGGGGVGVDSDIQMIGILIIPLRSQNL